MKSATAESIARPAEWSDTSDTGRHILTLGPDGVSRIGFDAPGLEAPEAGSNPNTEALKWVLDETYDYVVADPSVVTAPDSDPYVTEVPRQSLMEQINADAGTLSDVFGGDVPKRQASPTFEQIMDGAYVDVAFGEGLELLRRRDARAETTTKITTSDADNAAFWRRPIEQTRVDSGQRRAERARLRMERRDRLAGWADRHIGSRLVRLAERTSDIRESIKYKAGSVALLATLSAGAIPGLSQGESSAAERHSTDPIRTDSMVKQNTLASNPGFQFVGRLSPDATVAPAGSEVRLDLDEQVIEIQTVVEPVIEQPTPEPEAHIHPSDAVNLDAIGEIKRGVDPERIKTAMHHMIDHLGITPRAAADWAGTFLQESGLDPNSYNPKENGIGIIQWQGGREVNVPRGSLTGQIEYVFTELGDELTAEMRDPHTTDERIREIIYKHIRWGHTGERWGYADQILRAIHS